MFNLLLRLILYSVLVQNILGAGITFIYQPNDTIISPGQIVVLNCKAELHTPTGNRPALIKWKNLQDGEVLRAQAANGSLILNKLFTSDESKDVEQFQCIASIDNVGIAVSRIASVRRAKPPEFLQQPVNITSYEGQIAQFPCLVSPNLHARVTWLKNKRPFVMAEAQESRMLILPSGTLEIEYVESSDSGVYQCNVSIPGANSLSDEAYLTVNSPIDVSGHTLPPTFVSKPQNLEVESGESLTLDCAANGIPRPSITWLKDGLDIDLEDLDSRFSKVGTGSLQITRLQAEDEGNYVCRAGNREDSVDASATIHVLVPPKFTKLPEDMHARSKDDVELQCRVFGKPQPKVIWLKNGELITQNDYIQISGNNNLRIQGTLKLDSGIFQCSASNSAGNIQTSSLLLISDMDPSTTTSSRQSQQSPAPMASLPPLEIETGSIEATNDSLTLPSAPQSLSAIMVGPRSVALRWLPPALPRGEVLVYCIVYKQEGSDRERVFNASARAEETIIQALHPNTSYSFRVLAYTSLGPGLASSPLLVKTEPEDHVPSPPRNLNIPVVGTSSLLITWDKPAVLNGEIKHYTLYYLEEDTSVERHVVTSQLSYELRGLSHFTLYSIWVVAHNSNGAGTTSMELSVQTLSDKPSEPPANVTVEPSGATSITVKWQPPSKKGQNGIITGYKLRYKKKDVKKDKGETVTTAGDRRLYVVTGLNKSTSYQVKLWAMNVNGSGPATDWLTAETYSQDLGEFTVPDFPASLKARPGGPSSILVSWTPPADQSIMVRGFTLGWGKGVPDEFVKQILDVKQRSDEITGLEPNSDYVISLRAFNDMGDGPLKYEYLRTRNEPPPQAPKVLIPPMGLKAEVLGPNSIRVSWIDTTLPDQQHVEEGRHYLVRYTHLLGAARYKYVSSNATSIQVNDLKPSTQYEFTVKVVRSKRESEWSMIVLNTTQEAPPASAPRDLTVVSKEGDPSLVNLNWQPPKQANGQISGYSILYSSDPSTNEWMEENVVGDKMSTNVRDLEPGRIYYFKIKAKNSAGNSPYSSTVTWTTSSDMMGIGVQTNNQVSNTMILYTIVGCCVAFAIYVVVVVIVLCCCRINSSEERSKKGYVKGNTGKLQPPAAQINPPDLWIHHDQMELKAIEKSSQGSLDIAPAATQLQGDYEPPPKSTHTASTPSSNNSLDKHHRAFATSYIGMSQTPAEARPLYPRSQYSGSTTRAHVTVDASGGVEGAYVVHTGIEPVPANSLNYGNPHGHPPSHPIHAVPPPSHAVDSNPKVKRQGHPLKSFTVPAPPPTSSAPTTPQQKHVVTVRPQGSSSPYKKSSHSALWPSALSESAELSPLKGTYSTEELTQEMANLEGLMKDLDAITASEFKC